MCSFLRCLALVLVVLCYPYAARAESAIFFEGMIDLQSGKLSLHSTGTGGDQVILDVEREKTGDIRFVCDVKHLTTSLFELSTVVQGGITGRQESAENYEIAAEASSHYTLLDHQPIRDLDLKMRVRNGTLFIDTLWAGALSVQGTVALSGDHNAQLAFDLLPTDLADLLAIVRLGNAAVPAVSGVLTGTFTLTGPLAKPDVKGRFASYGGRFKEMNFDSIVLLLQGTFPHLSLDGTTVTQTDGFSFKVNGAIDLSDLNGLANQIRGVTRKPIISGSDEDSEWVIKRLRSDRAQDNITEMKYFLLKDDRGDAEGVIGVEKKIGF